MVHVLARVPLNGAIPMPSICCPLAMVDVGQNRKPHAVPVPDGATLTKPLLLFVRGCKVRVPAGSLAVLTKYWIDGSAVLMMMSPVNVVSFPDCVTPDRPVEVASNITMIPLLLFPHY